MNPAEIDELDLNENLIFRPMEEKDKEFIYSSWLLSYRKAPENYRLRDPIYFDWRKPQVNALVDRSAITVASVKSDPWLILGYIVIEPSAVRILHYLNVRLQFRQLGIAKRLLAHAVTTDTVLAFSHMTRALAIDRLLDSLTRRGVQVIYDPRLKEAA